jgi:hypothetical protein
LESPVTGEGLVWARWMWVESSVTGEGLA